ncbi:MAG: hypothetical protein OEZ54_07020 [Gemmatimonadota bacterium]|nr:hypothetical protein [Gemmatimonadota bacterium]
MADVHRELSRAATGQFTLTLPLNLDSNHRYVILSDQHKGAGDKADEFRKCRDTYVTALNHYNQQGFTLILLGDVEELWEQSFKAVRTTYDDVMKLEGSFGPGRYFRIWGNHDDDWMNDRLVRKWLSPYMPGGSVLEGIRFEASTNGSHVGTALLLHGHQGTFASDKIRSISRLGVRLYRYLQRWFGIGKTTPASNTCSRGDHDDQMYEWARRQQKMILIAGHTHRPIWSSKTHLQKLEAELEALDRTPQSPTRDAAIEKKKKEIEERKEKYPPCNDTIKSVPCYFNTGCCRFDDGDITGMEIENGSLRLIKWANDERTALESEKLQTIFEAL